MRDINLRWRTRGKRPGDDYGNHPYSPGAESADVSLLLPIQDARAVSVDAAIAAKFARSKQNGACMCVCLYATAHARALCFAPRLNHARTRRSRRSSLHRAHF